MQRNFSAADSFSTTATRLSAGWVARAKCVNSLDSSNDGDVRMLNRGPYPPRAPKASDLTCPQTRLDNRRQPLT